jgi:hypothetical protein
VDLLTACLLISALSHLDIDAAKVAKIVGWSASTMVLMAKRYGHFALNDLRDAVESISKGKIDAGSLVFSPVSETREKADRPN